MAGIMADKRMAGYKGPMLISTAKLADMVYHQRIPLPVIFTAVQLIGYYSECIQISHQAGYPYARVYIFNVMFGNVAVVMPLSDINPKGYKTNTKLNTFVYSRGVVHQDEMQMVVADFTAAIENASKVFPSPYRLPKEISVFLQPQEKMTRTQRIAVWLLCLLITPRKKTEAEYD